MPQDEQDQDKPSRLSFHCQNCDLRGERSASYKFLEGESPAFTDECPRCGSDDLDVLDGEKSIIPENRGWDYRRDAPAQEDVEEVDSDDLS